MIDAPLESASSQPSRIIRASGPFADLVITFGKKIPDMGKADAEISAKTL
jgi:hypothetical protein